jgi:tetratricopeptide (TPR) repeat protein
MIAVLLMAMLAAGPGHHRTTARGGSAAARQTAPKVSPLAVYLEEGRHKEGLAWLHAFGHDTPDEVRYRGLFHHGLAEPERTLEVLVPVYRAHPEDDEVALAVAEASLWKKDYRTAATVLGQLKAPEAPEALRVRGLLFEQAGRLPEALAVYDRAVPLLKRPWGTLERKAQVLSWLKRFPEAAAAYRQVVESKQASVGLRQRCRVRLAELRAWQKDFEGALGQLDQLLGEDPHLVDAMLLRGQILEWQGHFVEAKQTYSRVLAVDSGQAEARLRLGKLLWVK